MRKIFPIVVLLIFYSCVKGYGTAYVENNLTIYYTNNSDLQFAKRLAKFWFENKLIQNKQQFIRINALPNKSRQIQLITNDIKTAKQIGFEELSKLQMLENQLNSTIFKDAKIDVVICDNRFNVLNDLNY
jgi:hypothetical protein